MWLKLFKDLLLFEKFNISSIWDYTVLSHFQCFSMEATIVNMKVIACDSGPYYIS